MRKKTNKKITIGWREYVDLPEWGLHNIRAKVDTGARTSALHVEDVDVLDHGRIRFTVVVGAKKTLRKKRITAKVLKRGRVKSSTGTRTERWYVRTKIRIGCAERFIMINLSSRGEMNFRMLLGRTAVDEAFLIDPDKSFLLSEMHRGKK
jgi:hypothetical protein